MPLKNIHNYFKTNNLHPILLFYPEVLSNIIVQKIIEFFIRLVYPEICHQCRKTLPLELKCLCSSCHKQFKSEIYDFFDCEIPHKSVHIRNIWSLAPYQKMTKKILKSFKFDKQFHLIRLFESMIVDFYSAIQPEIKHDLIIFIPSGITHKIDRFYCIAEEFAKILCSRFKIKSGNLFVHKKFAVPSQSHLDQEERLANLYGAFKISHSSQIKGKNILVVDDIYTTGATVQEMARVLKNSGAETIDCLTLARTLKSNTRK